MWPFSGKTAGSRAPIGIPDIVKRGLLRGDPRSGARNELLPAPIFHITHWKSGSQWVNRLLHELMFERLVVAVEDQSQFYVRPIERGKIYPTVYVTKEQFESVQVPPDHKRFVIIRDLRDTLISMYFSVKNSHDLLNPGLASLRCGLMERDLEEGMLFSIDYIIPRCAVIQQSWARAGEPLVKYEEFLAGDQELYARLLNQECRLNIDPARLKAAVDANRFERWSGGRKRGEENVNAHERKGIEGDWKNHFTSRVKRAFKERYGDLLIQTGYEKDHSW